MDITNASDREMHLLAVAVVVPGRPSAASVRARQLLGMSITTWR